MINYSTKIENFVKIQKLELDEYIFKSETVWDGNNYNHLITESLTTQVAKTFLHHPKRDGIILCARLLESGIEDKIKTALTVLNIIFNTNNSRTALSA